MGRAADLTVLPEMEAVDVVPRVVDTALPVHHRTSHRLSAEKTPESEARYF